MSAAEWSELEGYEALVSALRASAPAAPESLRQRVLEGASAPHRRRSRRQRLLFVVVPAAVVLAVGAALVRGFVSSGSHPSTAAHSAPLRAGASKTVRREGAPQTVTTPAAGLADAAARPSAQSKRILPGKNTGTLSSLHSYSQGKAPERVFKGSFDQAVTIPRNRLVHAVASLEVGVKGSKLSQATNEASQIVGSFGGYAQSVRFESSHQGGGSAVLALRVPVQKAQAAIAKLSTLGKLLSQQVSTQDLQTKLSSQNSGIGSLRRAIAVYQNALESTTLSASERVTIQIRLSNARHALARLRHARNGTLAAGATADISLVLTTQNHAIIPLHHHHGSTRFGRLLGSAAHFLAWEGIIVLYALVVISPVLVLGGLAWLLLRERRRREERLLARA
jgi:hypothetical protein